MHPGCWLPIRARVSPAMRKRPHRIARAVGAAARAASHAACASATGGRARAQWWRASAGARTHLSCAGRAMLGGAMGALSAGRVAWRCALHGSTTSGERRVTLVGPMPVTPPHARRVGGATAALVCAQGPRPSPCVALQERQTSKKMSTHQKKWRGEAQDWAGALCCACGFVCRSSEALDSVHSTTHVPNSRHPATYSCTQLYSDPVVLSCTQCVHTLH